LKQPDAKYLDGICRRVLAQLGEPAPGSALMSPVTLGHTISENTLRTAARVEFLRQKLRPCIQQAVQNNTSNDAWMLQAEFDALLHHATMLGYLWAKVEAGRGDDSEARKDGFDGYKKGFLARLKKSEKQKATALEIAKEICRGQKGVSISSKNLAEKIAFEWPKDDLNKPKVVTIKTRIREFVKEGKLKVP
jgi:hypothetical protein